MAMSLLRISLECISLVSRQCATRGYSKGFRGSQNVIICLRDPNTVAGSCAFPSLFRIFCVWNLGVVCHKKHLKTKSKIEVIKFWYKSCTKFNISVQHDKWVFMWRKTWNLKWLWAFCALAWNVSPLSRGKVQQGVIPRGSAGAKMW